MNLKSSVNKMGRQTQIIHFRDNTKRTINHILPETIKQGELTKFETSDGIMVLVNVTNVNMIEVFKEN